MKLFQTLLVGVLLAAWADAQQAGAALTAAERLKQLQNNRALLSALVNRSVAYVEANDPLRRAETCRGAMTDLAKSLDAAILARDAERIAELGDHYAMMADEALLPIIREAAQTVPTTSPDRDRLVALHKAATEDLQQLEWSVPVGDTLGRSKSVKEMLARWQASRAQLSAALK